MRAAAVDSSQTEIPNINDLEEFGGDIKPRRSFSIFDDKTQEVKEPASAFLRFASDGTRAKICEEHPKWKTSEIGKELGRLWKELDPAKKEIYKKQRDDAWFEFMKMHPNFKHHGGRTSLMRK
jgi:hypothetical protein